MAQVSSTNIFGKRKGRFTTAKKLFMSNDAEASTHLLFSPERPKIETAQRGKSKSGLHSDKIHTIISKTEQEERICQQGNSCNFFGRNGVKVYLRK